MTCNLSSYTEQDSVGASKTWKVDGEENDPLCLSLRFAGYAPPLSLDAIRRVEEAGSGMPARLTYEGRRPFQGSACAILIATRVYHNILP